jgi:hypothetical protein
MASTNKDNEKKKVKVKITKRETITVFVIIAAVLLVYAIALFIPKPVYSVCYRGSLVGSECYDGVFLNFRVNLRDAIKVPAVPGPDQIYTEVLNPLVKNITVVYKPTGDPEKDKLYWIACYDIIYNLKSGMLARRISDVGFDIKALSELNRTNYEKLPGMIQHPLVVLVDPADSNQTRVYADPGHVIYIEATSYDNMNLAIAKFLIAVLDIKF